MDPGPTYVLITAMCVLGVTISFVIFLNTENSMVPLFISAIVTLAGLAYGVETMRKNNELKKANKNGQTTG